MPKIYRGLTIELHRKVAWRLLEIEKNTTDLASFITERYPQKAPCAKKLLAHLRTLDDLKDAMLATAKEEYGHATFYSFKPRKKTRKKLPTWGYDLSDKRVYPDAVDGSIVTIYEYDIVLTGARGAMPCPACDVVKVWFPRPRDKKHCISCGAVLVMDRVKRVRTRTYLLQAIVKD